MIVKIKREYKTLADKKDNYQWHEKAHDKMCINCIFVGELPFEIGCQCGKHLGEIVRVSDCGTCDAHKNAAFWYNRINPIKYMILKNHGFKFRNR